MNQSRRAEMNHHAKVRSHFERMSWKWRNDAEFRRRELMPQLQQALEECESDFQNALQTVEKLCGDTYPERVAEYRKFAEQERNEKMEKVRAKFEAQMK